MMCCGILEPGYKRTQPGTVDEPDVFEFHQDILVPILEKTLNLLLDFSGVMGVESFFIYLDYHRLFSLLNVKVHCSSPWEYSWTFF
jgi:hypothetical protein